MKNAICGALAVVLASCSSGPASNGATGGGQGGGGQGGGAGGGQGGGGGGVCPTSCSAYGDVCGEAVFDCGAVDCGTCRVQGQSTGFPGANFALAGLPKGVAIAYVEGGVVRVAVPQDAGAPGFDGGFESKTVAPLGGTMSYPMGLAASASGDFWVTWMDTDISPSRVLVASSAGGFVPEQAGVGLISAIALDGQGSPRVIYSGFLGPTTGVFEAFRDAGTWQSTLVETGVARSVAIAIDPAGRSQLLYALGNTGGINHAWRDGGGYGVTPIVPSGSLQGSPKVAMVADSKGDLHAVWAVDFKVSSGRRDATGWQVTVIPGRADSNTQVDVALQADHPRIVFVGEDFATYVALLGSDAIAAQALNRTNEPYIANAVDGTGKLWIGDVIGGQLVLRTFGERYPAGHLTRFRQVLQTLCTKAIACKTDAGDDACISIGSSSSCSFPDSYCPTAMMRNLWTVTIDAGILETCEASLGTTTCGPVGSAAEPGVLAPAACHLLAR